MEGGMGLVYGITFFSVVVALAFALWLHLWVKRQPVQNPVIREVSGLIKAGANTFMRKEYRVLAVFADGLLRVFAGGGWNTFRPREIQFVEERPVTGKYRVYSYGALDISLRDGRILHVDLADSVAEAKERLLELKTRDTILEEQENEKSPPVWDPSSDPLPEE